MKCNQCGRDGIELTEKNCPGCGVSFSSVKPKDEERYSPYHFHGFMIWPSYDYASRSETSYIYEGEKLVSQFTITHEMMIEFEQMYGGGVGAEPLKYKLLRLAIGDSEVERIEQLNQNGKDIIFEIKRMERPTEAALKAQEILSELRWS